MARLSEASESSISSVDVARSNYLSESAGKAAGAGTTPEVVAGYRGATEAHTNIIDLVVRAGTNLMKMFAWWQSSRLS